MPNAREEQSEMGKYSSSEKASQSDKNNACSGNAFSESGDDEMSRRNK
jgi:hypothetical protein